MTTNSNALAQNSNKNILLIKGDVGKAKPSVYHLPDENYSYGKAYVKDKEGAKEVSMTWNFHQSTRDPLPIADFKKINKDKINPKLKEQEKTEENMEKRQSAKKNILPDENFIYGKKVKPSTPIGKLLSNDFGEESENVLNAIYTKQIEEKNVKKKLEVKQNKSQLLSSNKNKQKIEEKAKENEKPKVFTLKKFQKVEARINTNTKQKKPQDIPQNEELKLVEKYFEQNDKNKI